jgi:hypothetical protein
MSTLLVLALVAAAPTVQQKQVALTPAQRLALVMSPCLTAPADATKTLASGKKSVAIEVPNMTVAPIVGDTPPDACEGYIAQIEVPSTSTPPSGYGTKLDITVSVSGTYVPKETCQAFASSVGIYKVKSDGTLAYKGGGNFTATWNEAVDPDTCNVVAAPDFETVSGSVPDSGTAKWRIIVRSGGNVIVKAARRKT